ncbi:porin [Paraburkholderia sp. BL17N1]|uniref:porin n=1 Tax=Paraburkholderia sp. BL17N1 TaxID=1938798 RepID=UPI0013158CE9|nr:porin [Paraburkholderia sp. BL17N1]
MMAITSGLPAQSAVTLYGSIDESLLLNTNNNGSRAISLSDNGIQGNRVGLSGTENLGSGMRAVFRLENGFNASNGVLGQGARLFGSQAYVGLAGDFGSLRAGRQLNTDVALIAPDFAAASQWAGILGSHPGDVDNFYDTFRVPGALKYVAPQIRGFNLQLLYAPGGVAGHITRGQVASIAATYDVGSVVLGASYNNVQSPNRGLAAETANVNIPVTTAGVYFLSPVDSGFASAHTYQVFSCGASYNVGSAMFGVLYTNTQFQGLGDLDAGPNALQYTGNAIFQNIEFNVRYTILPSLIFGSAFNVTTRNSVSTIDNPNGLGSASYIQTTIGIQYFLQKTTFIYAEAMIQKASGVDSTGQTAVAANNFIGRSSNSTQTAVRVGLNVHF